MKEEEMKEEASPVETEDDEVIKIQKFNMKSNEGKKEEYLKQIELEKEKRENLDEQFNIQIEETELMSKLYGEFGEDYVKMDEWKNFVVSKKLPFALKMKKKAVKDVEASYKFQLKQIQQGISGCDTEIVRAKAQIRLAKLNKNHQKT